VCWRCSSITRQIVLGFIAVLPAREERDRDDRKGAGTGKHEVQARCTPGACAEDTGALERLLASARQQGYITYDDLMEAIPEAELNLEQLEDALSVLIEQALKSVDVEGPEPVAEQVIRKRGGDYRTDPRIRRPDRHRHRRLDQPLPQGNRRIPS